MLRASLLVVAVQVFILAPDAGAASARRWNVEPLSHGRLVANVREFADVIAHDVLPAQLDAGLGDDELAGVIHEAALVLGEHPGPVWLLWDEHDKTLELWTQERAPRMVRAGKRRSVSGAEALRLSELGRQLADGLDSAAIAALYDGKPLRETVGVVTEVKANEKRVGMTPAGVRDLRAQGIPVVVQQGAGAASGFSDEEYRAAGARLVDSAQQVFAEATLIKHVKELQPNEYALLKPHHVVFTYNHFEEDEGLTSRSIASQAAFVSYEKVAVGRETPMLAPMSRIAGKLSAYWSAFFPMLRTAAGEAAQLDILWGMYPRLLANFPAKPEGLGLGGKKVVVLGGGVAGFAAAEMAKQMGASVAVSEIDRERVEQVLRAGMDRIDGKDDAELDRRLVEADVIIGAVYVKGKAPAILKEERLRRLSDARHGRPFLIIDIAVDQGGNIEFIRRAADGATFVSHDKTSHLEPIAEDAFGNLLVRIPNMPAAVPRQASLDLERATLPYLRALSFGLDRAMRELPELVGGLSIRLGRILDRRVAEAHPSL